jgi:hypothetical protein
VITALLTTAALVLSPGPARSCAPPLDPTERGRADAVASALRDAEAAATEDPEAGLAGLEAALAQAERSAELVARDGNATDARLYAQLALARSLLATDRRADAVKVIDRALATAGGRELPVKLFGPTLVSLHDERRAAVGKAPRGTLEVHCADACFVAIEATAIACGVAGAPERVELPVGSYHVLVLDRDQPERRKEQTVEITAGAVQAVTLDNAAAADTKPRGRRQAVAPTADGPRRRLPRWAGILGMAAGAAAIVAGGVLVGVHGECPDFTSNMGEGACKRTLNTRTTGYVVLGAGAAFMVGFTIPFAIGESREAKARKRNTAMWRPLGPLPGLGAF